MEKAQQFEVMQHVSPAFYQRLLVSFFLLSTLLASAVWTDAETVGEGLTKEFLRVALIESAFDGVSANDAGAAFKVFAESLGVSYGYDIDVDIKYFSDVTEFSAVLKQQNLDIVLFDSWSWLDLKNKSWIEPVFVASEQGSVAHRFLLVAKQDGGLKNFLDFEGGSLNLFHGSNSQLGKYWLDRLVYSLAGQEPEQFFSEIKHSTDPMNTVLPVFFGRKDFAVIPENKFELMAELNPQLNKLMRVEVSEPYVNTLICMKKDGWTSDHFHRTLIEAMQEFHLNPSGRQILTLFKINELLPYKNEYLDSVRKLKASFSSGV